MSVEETAVRSPCTGVCRLDEARRVCMGCRRTLEEIGRWRDMSDAERRHVLRRLAAIPGATPLAAGDDASDVTAAGGHGERDG